MSSPVPTPKTRVYMIGARTGLAFRFHHRTPQEIIDEMTGHEWIKPADEDDPFYVPGLFRWTRAGARAGNESHS